MEIPHKDSTEYAQQIFLEKNIKHPQEYWRISSFASSQYNTTIQ